MLVNGSKSAVFYLPLGVLGPVYLHNLYQFYGLKIFNKIKGRKTSNHYSKIWKNYMTDHSISLLIFHLDKCIVMWIGTNQKKLATNPY